MTNSFSRPVPTTESLADVREVHCRSRELANFHSKKAVKYLGIILSIEKGFRELERKVGFGGVDLEDLDPLTVEQTVHDMKEALKAKKERVNLDPVAEKLQEDQIEALASIATLGWGDRVARRRAAKHFWLEMEMHRCFCEAGAEIARREALGEM